MDIYSNTSRSDGAVWPLESTMTLMRMSILLTYLLACLYTLLGGTLFFAPVQSAPYFAWKVSAFVAMTIGAWCLGNAWLAWVTAARWHWPRVRTALIYLWLFGLFQTAVVVMFREKLQLTHPIAWLYVSTLVTNALAGALGLSMLLQRSMSGAAVTENPTFGMRAFVAAYVVFVGFLAAFGAARGLTGRGAAGAVFPEALSAFSVSSFAAFYLALALSALPLLWSRDRGTLSHHAFASYGLVFIITAATVVYIDSFDFAARPLGFLYIGAYVGVGVVTAFYLIKYGTRVPSKIPEIQVK